MKFKNVLIRFMFSKFCGDVFHLNAHMYHSSTDLININILIIYYENDYVYHCFLLTNI